MGSGPSVLTVQSLDTDKDCAALLELFPDRFRVEHEEESSSKVLVDGDDRLTVLLVASKAPGKVTWVAEGHEIDEIAKRKAGFVLEIENSSAVVINLPGGSSIVMVPTTLLVSCSARKSLAAFLADAEKSATEGYSVEDVDLSSEASEEPVRADLPPFPSLQVKLLQQNGEFKPNFPVNSRLPVNFETDLFKGKVLLLLRPMNIDDDPYWTERLFSRKKRRIILQIQGKFKREPKGTVFVGAEISQEMKVGLLTRGVLSLIIRLLESVFSGLRYSFGDSNDKELPRIAAPAHTAFEQIIVTPYGGTPPELNGEDFNESQESIDRRQKAIDWKFSTANTYSFSFYSMYVDLPTWHAVNLKVTNDINLKNFWSDADLRVVLYEKTGGQKQHFQASNQYAFLLQAKFLGKKRQTGNSEAFSSDEEDDLLKITSRRGTSFEDQDLTEDSVEMRRVDSQTFPALMLADSDDEEHFFDAEETNANLEYEQVSSNSMPALTVDLLSTVDSIVPAWIDMISGRGSYMRTYAINMGSRTTFRSSEACELLIKESGVSDLVLRLVGENFSPRISFSERIRRILGLVLVRGDQTKLQAFKALESQFDHVFLHRADPASLSAQKRSAILVSGFVARAISDRHWIEEWAKVTNRYISFYYHPEKKKPQFRVTISSVVKVQRLAPEINPHFPGHHFLVIETLGRSVYLMFNSEIERDAWLDVISRLHRLAREDDASVDSYETDATPRLMEFDNPAEEFLHKSSMWSCKNRRLLNCRRFSFRTQTTAEDPLVLVDQALRLALMPAESDDYERRRSFLNSAAALKRAHVQNLPEESRLCFFLNLYHTMILHAFLILGPPGSSLKWLSYFNNIAYEVGDDIFSLAELEHNIIRSQMAYPSQFISRFVLPKSHYRMALTKADYRINFALNCGSSSNPSSIYIYRVQTLHEQLDAACRLYLQDTMVTQRSKREIAIALPRICQWFAEDFGHSHEHLLSKVAPYLRSSERKKLAGCRLSRERRFDMSSVTIRFKDYSFSCGPLTLAT